MFKAIAGFALGFILALCACSRQKTLTTDEISSQLLSAQSLAAETAMFLDYVRENRATKHYVLGQIVFTTQAGALFGYQLMWAIALGTAAIIIYMEMCGRVAVVAKEPVFAVVHTRLGKKLGLAALIASNLLNLITCAAEIGGIAILL